MIMITAYVYMVKLIERFNTVPGDKKKQTIVIAAMLVHKIKEIVKIFLWRVTQHGCHEVR